MSRSRKIKKDSSSDISDDEISEDSLNDPVEKKHQEKKRPIDYNKLKRQEKQTCLGLAEDGTKCTYQVADGFKCCSRAHGDMENYIDHMFENLQLCKSCPRPRWRYFGDLDRCGKCQNNRNTIYCSGLESDGNRCHLKKASGKRFCARNHSYMEDYTEDMQQKENLKYCKGCKKWRYFGHFGNNATCTVVCQKRGDLNRSKQREKDKQNKDNCKHNGCRRFAQDGKNFCGDHKLDQKIVDADNSLMKLCATYNRKCTQPLLPPDYAFAKCEGCRERERKKERVQTQERKDKGACPSCGKESDDVNEFIDARGAKTMKCQNCRETQRRIDKSARSEGRKKSYPMSEETKEKKKTWKQNNHAKTVGYWLKYRAKRMAELGEKYWENNMLRARNCRAALTKEQRFMYNEGKRKDINHKLKYYKDRAKRGDILWDLTDERAMELFKDECTYCGCDADQYHNGIDRIDNTKGYTETNVTPACRICNMLKACMDYDIFLKRCEHILTQLGLANGRLHTNIYPNSKTQSIASYKKRAEYKKMEFTLTEDEFNTLVSGSCYLCGTQSFNNHINGIDRYDSKKGYTLENSRTCCTECNYMKNNYSYDVFINKLLQIYETNGEIISKISSLHENSMDIVCNELYLYQRCESKDSMMRSDFFIPNILIGKWGVINKPAEENFLILQSNDLDENIELEEVKVTLDNQFHFLYSIVLSQGHNDHVTFKMDNKEYMTVIAHDSMLCTMIPMMHKKITVKMYYIENKVVKIIFSVDHTLTGYCKCAKCTEHKDKNGRCLCTYCFNHILHGHIDATKCFWCSKNYDGDKFKSHSLKIIGNNNLIKTYTCARVENNQESIRNAFTKMRRAKVANNLRRYRSSRTTEEQQTTREYDTIRKREYRAGLKTRTLKVKAIKTTEQKREEARARKQKSRQAMKDKYGDATWRDIHAKQISIQRLKSNHNDENHINDKIDQIQAEIDNLK